MFTRSRVSTTDRSGKIPDVGNRDFYRNRGQNGGHGGAPRPPRRTSAPSASRRIPAIAGNLAGQVLFCTVADQVVQLDIIADPGALPIGTPFVVKAELPGGFLGAVVDSVMRRWITDGTPVTSHISRCAGHTRIDLTSASTRIVLDVDSLSLPTPRAA